MNRYILSCKETGAPMRYLITISAIIVIGILGLTVLHFLDKSLRNAMPDDAKLTALKQLKSLIMNSNDVPVKILDVKTSWQHSRPTLIIELEQKISEPEKLCSVIKEKAMREEFTPLQPLLTIKLKDKSEFFYKAVINFSQGNIAKPPQKQYSDFLQILEKNTWFQEQYKEIYTKTFSHPLILIFPAYTSRMILAKIDAISTWRNQPNENQHFQYAVSDVVNIVYYAEDTRKELFLITFQNYDVEPNDLIAFVIHSNSKGMLFIDSLHKLDRIFDSEMLKELHLYMENYQHAKKTEQ